ncbi:MarR family winged helix-turn-helix transcriptional regulator [Mumia flava]|nr:MarR family winged helix-turn-helix transcriptional regulator [Mumia flava]
MPSVAGAERLAVALTHLGRALRSNAHRWEPADTRLRRADVAVLKRLATAGEQRVTAIADSFGLNPSVVSRQVTALEAAGLVERRPDPADARAGLISLTDAGRDELSRIWRAYAERLCQQVPDWDDETTDRFADLSVELAASMLRDELDPVDA